MQEVWVSSRSVIKGTCRGFSKSGGSSSSFFLTVLLHLFFFGRFVSRSPVVTRLQPVSCESEQIYRAAEPASSYFLLSDILHSDAVSEGSTIVFGCFSFPKRFLLLLQPSPCVPPPPRTSSSLTTNHSHRAPPFPTRLSLAPAAGCF